MDLTKGDVVIFSGEGTEGTWERYHGARTEKAIRSRLSRERIGDRWADAWIELDGIEDAGFPGEKVYGKLGRDLNEIADQRAVPAALIRDNPAAMLAAQKRGNSAASAENGKKGGRPKTTFPLQCDERHAFPVGTRAWMNPATGSIDSAGGWEGDYLSAIESSDKDTIDSYGGAWNAELIEVEWNGKKWAEAE